MTETLLHIAAGLIPGVIVGLRIRQRRFLLVREQLRDATERISAWKVADTKGDLDLVGPVTGPTKTVELYDQDATLPEARCDFNGPWNDTGLCVPVDWFDVPVLEMDWQVQLHDAEGNRCRGHVVGFHAGHGGSIAEIDLDQSTWESACPFAECPHEDSATFPRVLPTPKVSD